MNMARFQVYAKLDDEPPTEYYENNRTARRKGEIGGIDVAREVIVQMLPHMGGGFVQKSFNLFKTARPNKRKRSGQTARGRLAQLLKS